MFGQNGCTISTYPYESGLVRLSTRPPREKNRRNCLYVSQLSNNKHLQNHALPIADSNSIFAYEILLTVFNLKIVYLTDIRHCPYYHALDTDWAV